MCIHEAVNPTREQELQGHMYTCTQLFLLELCETVKNKKYHLGGNKQVVKYKYFVVFIIILTFVHNISMVSTNNKN